MAPENGPLPPESVPRNGPARTSLPRTDTRSHRKYAVPRYIARQRSMPQIPANQRGQQGRSGVLPPSTVANSHAENGSMHLTRESPPVGAGLPRPPPIYRQHGEQLAYHCLEYGPINRRWARLLL